MVLFAMDRDEVSQDYLQHRYLQAIWLNWATSCQKLRTKHDLQDCSYCFNFFLRVALASACSVLVAIRSASEVLSTLQNCRQYLCRASLQSIMLHCYQRLRTRHPNRCINRCVSTKRLSALRRRRRFRNGRPTHAKHHGFTPMFPLFCCGQKISLVFARRACAFPRLESTETIIDHPPSPNVPYSTNHEKQQKNDPPTRRRKSRGSTSVRVSITYCSRTPTATFDPCPSEARDTWSTSDAWLWRNIAVIGALVSIVWRIDSGCL